MNTKRTAWIAAEEQRLRELYSQKPASASQRLGDGPRPSGRRSSAKRDIDRSVMYGG